MIIKFKRLSEKAVQSSRATSGSAGYDLTCSRITTELNECGQVVLVYHTDLALEIPEGYEAQLRTRSSISKKSLRLCTGMSTIDSDYKEGERVAQLAIAKVESPEFQEADELSETDRGTGGFGSTGTGVMDSAATGLDQNAHDKDTEEQPAGDDQAAPEQAAGDTSAPEQA